MSQSQPGTPADALGRSPASSLVSASPGLRTPARAPGALRAGLSPGGSPPGLSTPGLARVAFRGFLGTPPRGDAGLGDDAAGDDTGSFVYGTDLSVSKVIREFTSFIRTYRERDAAPDAQPLYLQELKAAWEMQQQKEQGIKFPIQGVHLSEFSPELYDNLVSFPTEIIPIFDQEMWNISVRELQAEPEDLGTCQVKIYELEPKQHKIMRSLNPSDIEHLVSLKGIVIRCSDLQPDMHTGAYQCTVEDCKHEEKVPLHHYTIAEPAKCEKCGASKSFQLIHNDCTFADTQSLKLQEAPELVPEGETPQNVVISCYDDLVDQVRPGDRVEVTGIYKAKPVRPMRSRATCQSVYRTYLDAVAIALEKKGRVDAPPEEELQRTEPPKLSQELDLDPERNTEDEIKWNRRVRQLAAETAEDGSLTVVRKFVKSFAPSIFEEDEVKKGLLCQLFGGTRKSDAHSSKGKRRPDINNLLCGDPSTAKSQLLQYAYKIAPRGVYTSGKGSSAVGLTATIAKDPVTKELVLESGALVLSDRGLCCIDEFDKMDENARAILHEAMEQQTVSIAKAGIVCSLNARTAVLASANCKDSAYDPKLSVVDNIALPKNLMTRFDFIWLMLDKRERETDSRLAEHLTSMYTVSGPKKAEAPPIEPELFRRYISFARRWVHPIISDAARDALVKSYTDLRNQGSSREVITATPRILESLIRISESLAKMELREEVTPADVDEAVRLMKAATYAAAVDPETGLIDMEQLIAGVSAAKRNRAKELQELIKEVVANNAGQMLTPDSMRASVNEKLGERRERLVMEGEFEQALNVAIEDGYITRRGNVLEARG